MPRVEVRYFSRLKEIANACSEVFQLDEGATIADLLTRIIVRHAAIAPLRSSLLIARNLEYATTDTAIAEGDTFDLMPPVSGG